MTNKSLQDFVEEVNGESHLRIEHDFGDGFVRLRTSEAERRQAAQDIQCSEHIVLELLRNSRDAHASHIFLATSKEGSKRTITVIDDGDGIPSAMHAHVFEARVTSKLDTSHMDDWGLHGRGMALFSIAQNAVSARIAESELSLGCSMHIVTDTSSLPEKTDQSGFPRFELVEGGNVNVRGPRNIIRTSCEFAIASRDSCEVYVGSPAEIAATLYEYGKSTLSAIDRAFCKDASSLPLTKRLAVASDPDDFACIASSLGLDISTRTSRRIIDGQVSEAASLLDMIVISDARDSVSNSPKKPSSSRAVRRIKLEKADKEAIADAMKVAFEPLAKQYYLNPDVEAHVSISGGKLIVSIPLVNDDA